MDVRSPAGLFWRGPVLAAAACLLAACATEMGMIQAEAASSPPAPTPTAQTASPPAAAARQPVELKGVEVQPAGSGGLVVLVKGDAPIPTYEAFTLPDPPRLVIDIPNAVHAIPQPIPAPGSLVTALRSSQYRERPVQIVRIVMDLRSAFPYSVRTAQNQLRVSLGSAVEVAGATPATPPATPPPAAPSAAPVAAPATTPRPAPAAPVAAAKSAGKVTKVDVQNVRGRQQIYIRTSGPVTYKVSEGTDPLRLSVDVAGATIEPSAARTVDLRQVTSPIDRLTASQSPDAEQVVRVTADLRGPVRYDVRQTPTAIVIDFLNPPRTASTTPAPASPTAPVASMAPSAPATPSPAGSPVASAAPSAGPPPPPPAGAPGTGRLSMDFKDADINNLLRIIAEVSGMNVVAGSDVTGKVTVRLVNVEWQQALDVILRINGMGYEMDGNIIRVAPHAKLAAEQRARDEAKAREKKAQEDALKAERDAKKEMVQLEPLLDEVIPVNYAKAADVVKNLDRLKTPARPDVSIVVDDRTNRLIIRETAGSLARMKTLLTEIDRATPQVLIEARLIEATRTFSQSLGIEWGFAATPGSNSIFTSFTGNSSLEAPTVPPIPLAISMPATSPTAGIGIISSINRFTLGARISAGESENRVRTLSAPKVSTMDNQEAEIKQGQQVPYTTIDSSGRTVVAFQDAFIRLKVTPHITNDRRISMKVEAERSFPGDRVDFAGGFVFPINTRKATTNVLISNGSTIVIGGLLQSDERWSESRVPWISKVPVLSSLFKSTSIGPESKIELLIFLTPTILEEARVS
jgi:type IV pilus assembly protein PilQ